MCVHVVTVCAYMWKTEVDMGIFLYLYPEAWSLPELTEPAGLGSQSVSFTVTAGELPSHLAWSVLWGL